MLALTLWILVAVLITVTFFAGRVERAVSLASDFRAATDAEIEMADARAEMLYRLSTSSLSAFGAGSGDPATTIRLDDRRYASGPTTEISVQDGRGLINVNNVDADSLGRFLAEFGIGASEADRLIDTLADYIDADSLKRLNGAEAPEYLAAKLPPPRNAPLLSTRELRRVMGWRDHLKLLDDPTFMDLLTASDANGLNPNTAPKAVLVSLPNVTPALADAIVASRNELPYASAALFATVIGADTVFALSRLNAFPSTRLRVTQTVPGRGWALRYDVALLPAGATAPWRIERASRIERPPATTLAKDAKSASREESATKTPALPPLLKRANDVPTERP